MKNEIHPKVREVIFQDTVSGAQYRALSAMKAEQTVTVEGKEYPLVKVDVSAASHPFYTGHQRILDTAGRVEKFGTKFGKATSTLLKKKPESK
jgi:large subunit ribosomal protein L31